MYFVEVLDFWSIKKSAHLRPQQDSVLFTFLGVKMWLRSVFGLRSHSHFLENVTSHSVFWKLPKLLLTESSGVQAKFWQNNWTQLHYNNACSFYWWCALLEFCCEWRLHSYVPVATAFLKASGLSLISSIFLFVCYKFCTRMSRNSIFVGLGVQPGP